MKESEFYRLGIAKDDNDLRALGNYTKVLRCERKEVFEEKWLPKLKKVVFSVAYRKNGSYTFQHPKYGFIDYFPKANKLLIRRKNKWIKPGLKWIVKNILS